MKICDNCVLPETLPSAHIDSSGLCQYCRKFKDREDLDLQREKYRLRFQSLIEEQRGQNSGAYDILAAYSGGKDSTFTLDLLKNRFGLRVLALTFDHGFVSPFAKANMERVVEYLGIDHLNFKPDFQLLKTVFAYSIKNEFHPLKALERASSICNSCMGMVKFITMRVALEKGIPLIAYGWSPGQAPLQSAIMKNQAAFLKKAQDLFFRPLRQELGDAVKPYFLEPRHFEAPRLPYNINPLAFLHYSEEDIYGRIQELGWRHPQDTDSNSTNCLLNGFANQVHLEKHGYHPYAMEMAGLVREGVLAREEALRRLDEPPDPEVLAKVKRKLGV